MQRSSAASGELVVCPYNDAHQMTQGLVLYIYIPSQPVKDISINVCCFVCSSRKLVKHLYKCRKDYEKKELANGRQVEIVSCRFNPSHRKNKIEIQYHEQKCPNNVPRPKVLNPEPAPVPETQKSQKKRSKRPRRSSGEAVPNNETQDWDSCPPALKEKYLEMKTKVEYLTELCEKRAVALDESAKEIAKLGAKVAKLEAENRELESLIQDATTLANMINDMGDEADESGIYVDTSLNASTGSIE